MRMPVYSILDRKLREFGGPFVDRNEESMRRSLEVGVRGSNSMVEKYPEDFDVYFLASLDTETGEIHPRTPTLVCGVFEILGMNIGKE